MTTRNSNKRATALAKAQGTAPRAGQSPDEHDRRVEQATATAFVALDVRRPLSGRCVRRRKASETRCASWSVRTSASSARQHCWSSTR
jgi:hypothetical protein